MFAVSDWYRLQDIRSWNKYDLGLHNEPRSDATKYADRKPIYYFLFDGNSNVSSVITSQLTVGMLMTQTFKMDQDQLEISQVKDNIAFNLVTIVMSVQSITISKISTVEMLMTLTFRKGQAQIWICQRPLISDFMALVMFALALTVCYIIDQLCKFNQFYFDLEKSAWLVIEWMKWWIYFKLLSCRLQTSQTYGQT